MNTITTPDASIILVQPDVDRDAPLGVMWLDGDIGRETLKLMGNTDENNKPSTLEQEKERVKGFIESTHQLNWMIQLNNKIVGAIWVDLEDNDYLQLLQFI